MPTSTIPNDATGIEEIRTNARQLLSRMLADRAEIEQRLTESGRIDPVRVVTGRSALDATIHATQRMLAMLDRIEQSDPVWRAANGRTTDDHGAPLKAEVSVKKVLDHAGAV